MFVAKWEPGVIPAKPELTSAPIWLELRNVPLQFFHKEGLERIAGLVGQPKFLHPSTANKINLDVAKVFTIIDPRKPLLEAVMYNSTHGRLEESKWLVHGCLLFALTVRKLVIASRDVKLLQSLAPCVIPPVMERTNVLGLSQWLTRRKLG